MMMSWHFLLWLDLFSFFLLFLKLKQLLIFVRPSHSPGKSLCIQIDSPPPGGSFWDCRQRALITNTLGTINWNLMYLLEEKGHWPVRWKPRLLLWNDTLWQDFFCTFNSSSSPICKMILHRKVNELNDCSIIGNDPILMKIKCEDHEEIALKWTEIFYRPRANAMAALPLR